jgi:DNA-binding NtrC family response regulator
MIAEQLALSSCDILVIEDEPGLRQLYGRLLRLEGYTVWLATNYREAETTLEREYCRLILTDVRLPDANALEKIAILKKRYPWVEIIVITAFATLADGLRALKSGAYDYLIKGDSDNQLIPTVAAALARQAKQTDGSIKLTSFVQSTTTKPEPVFKRLLGKAPAFRKAVEQAEKVARSEANVLLYGETGTGKEWFAQAIHQASNRATKSFVTLNCAAIPGTMLESELFGHKKGAFTGADRDKKGLLELADQGTVFLDELGELPLDLQAKLLRALEYGEFIRLGDTRPTRVNFRIIGATNRNLPDEIATGRFRSDLYYRIATFTLPLPPLRERTEDIELLCRHYLALIARRDGRPAQQFAPGVLEILKKYHWPGNIRELRNVVERACILADTSVVDLDCLPTELLLETRGKLVGETCERPIADTLHNIFNLQTIEKQQIIRALDYTGGNRSKTAELLGIGLATLYRKLHLYGIQETKS